MKKEYKQIMSKLRKQKRNRPKLIHLMINIKSHVMSFRFMEKGQLLYLVRRQKSWDGDVLSYFISEYGHLNFPNDFRPLSGNAYKSTKDQLKELSELPF